MQLDALQHGMLNSAHGPNKYPGYAEKGLLSHHTLLCAALWQPCGEGVTESVMGG